MTGSAGTGPATRRSIRVAGWSLVILLPGVLLGLIEATVRILDLEPGRGPRAAVPAWLDRNVLAKESQWIDLLAESPGDLDNYYRTYVWDRHLFYRLRPGLIVTLTDVTAPAAIRDRTRWTFSTNARGFTGPEVPYEKPPGTFRVVAMGDSSTFGWGVETEQSYPRVLETELRRRLPGRRIEVINLGVCGYTSLQGRVLLEREGLRYQPDIVTISYGSNDFSPVPEPFEEVYRRNLGWSGAARALLNHSRAYRLYASALLGAVQARGAPAAAPAEGGARIVLNVGPDASQENLIRMAGAASAGGADPIFVAHCTPGHLGEPMRRAAGASGAPLIESGPLLERSVEQGVASARFPQEAARLRSLYTAALMERFGWLQVYLTDHCHPNSIGHQLVAEALLPIVESTPAFRRFAGESPAAASAGGGSRESARRNR
ncbi:MAG TPA: GDSL-type esterase/lipase family protein [Candidatus Polarisedimenticolia bacterium]|nr:GDSL-type esterase/lipase family protein [Candidatus Polarisedimenticolia bacterium]